MKFANIVFFLMYVCVDVIMHFVMGLVTMIHRTKYVATLTLDLRTRQKGVARLQAKRKPGSHTTCSQECKKVLFPTTKSQESTRLPCVQIVCDIPLENSR
jgi:hypothetical protein